MDLYSLREMIRKNTISFIKNPKRGGIPAILMIEYINGFDRGNLGWLIMCVKFSLLAGLIIMIRISEYTFK